MFNATIEQLKNIKWTTVQEDFRKLPKDVKSDIRRFLLWILEEEKEEKNG